MAKPGPHEAPLSTETLLAMVQRALLKRALVVKGQYSPDPEKVERTLIYSHGGSRLSKVVDAWITPETFNEMLTSLRASCKTTVGSSDAMYGTAARHVWAHCAGELRLWRRSFLVGRFTGSDCRVRKTIIHPWTLLPNTSVSSIYAFLSATWAERGVRLERTPRRSIVIARATEPMALLDPTYDGIDLLCDASWAVDLARAVSSATSIPLKLHKDLR